MSDTHTPDTTALRTALDRAQAAPLAVSHNRRFMLSPRGQLTIVDADNKLHVLELQDTADLLVFLRGPAAENLQRDIIARAMYQAGGHAASAVAEIYALADMGYAKEALAAVEQEAERRGWEV